MKKLFLMCFGFISYSHAAFSYGFLDYCLEKQKYDESIKATVDALLQSAGEDLSSEGNCQRANSFLSAKSVLNLSDLGVRSLLPLRDIHPDVLILKNNHIKNLWPLVNNKNLLMLYLDNNEIEDITPLGFMPQITHLSLDQNQIFYVMPLKDVFQLEKVSLEDNPVYNDQDYEIAENIKNKMESLIYFRHNFGNHMYEMNFKDFEDASEALNLRAERGDIQHFRFLLEDPSSALIFSQATKTSTLLEPQTKKMLLAVEYGDQLSSSLIQYVGDLLDHKISASFLSARQKELTKVFEYFIAEGQLPPYSDGDVAVFKKAIFEKAFQLAQISETKLLGFLMPTAMRSESYQWAKRYKEARILPVMRAGMGADWQIEADDMF